MKYVTFYTEGYYEDVYKKYLKPSSESFGIDVRAYKEYNYKDWARNTHQKANVILRGLAEWGDLVWLDADSQLLKAPVLFDEIPQEFDMGLYYLDWEKHWRGKEGESKRELVNSVMMVRNRPNVVKLISDWSEKTRGANVCDQTVLSTVIKNYPDIKIFKLPDTYCAIIGHDRSHPNYIPDPVIVQHQASRDVKQNKALLEL